MSDYPFHEFEFTPLDDGRWIVTSPARGCAFKVNNFTMEIMRSMSGSRTLSDAFNFYCSQFSQELSPESYKDLVSKVQEWMKLRARMPRKTLTMGFTLLPHRIFSKISDKFTWLIKRSLLIANVTAFPIIMLLLANSPRSGVLKQGSSALFLSVVVTMSVLVHELGHGSALRKNGQNTGRLGVGVYLIYPVFFVELFAHEALNNEGKFWVNISGVYFQLLFANISAIIALAFGFAELANAAEIIYIFALIQLIPLNKSDGYWLVHDILIAMDKNRLLKKVTLTMNVASVPVLAFFLYGILFHTLLPYLSKIVNAGSVKGMLESTKGNSVWFIVFQAGIMVLVVTRILIKAYSSRGALRRLKIVTFMRKIWKY